MALVSQDISWDHTSTTHPRRSLLVCRQVRYPNPLGMGVLGFRENNEAIISNEYLSMTKHLVFEVGFSEKRNKV